EQRFVVRVWLVRVRGQGSAHTARPDCEGASPRPLLRARGPRGMPWVALAGARRRRRRIAGRTGRRSGLVARRRTAGADRLRPVAADDALDEPAHLPAGDLLPQPPALVARPYPSPGRRRLQLGMR